MISSKQIKILLIVSLYFYPYIFFSSKVALAGRPFVTEDGSTLSQYQFDAAVWGKTLHSDAGTSIAQFTRLGLGITDYLEVHAASARGYDFDKGKTTSSNPSFELKVKLLDNENLPLLALVSGANLRHGQQGSLHQDANSYYVLMALSKSFFKEKLSLNANIGKRFIHERYKNNDSHTYWGFSLETPIYKDKIKYTLELYRGDLYSAIVPQSSLQNGLSYLLSESIRFDLILGTQRRINSLGIKTRSHDIWGILGVNVKFKFHE